MTDERITARDVARCITPFYSQFRNNVKNRAKLFGDQEFNKGIKAAAAKMRSLSGPQMSSIKRHREFAEVIEKLKRPVTGDS